MSQRSAKLLALVFGAIVCLHPLLPAGTAQYSFRSWNSANGLPDNTIMAMVRTRDGFLWMTTDDGLVRFDGVRFRVFDKTNTPALLSTSFSFSVLMESNDGALWAGTVDGGVIRYKDGRFESISTRDGLPSNEVLRIDQDSAGVIYIFTRPGLSKWAGGKLLRVAPQPNSPFNGYLQPNNRQTGFDGSRWGLWRTEGLRLERFAYGAWQTFPLPPGMKSPGALHIRSIYEDSRGTVWYNAYGYRGQYFRVKGTSLTAYRGFPRDGFVCWQDDDGALWLSDHQGHAAIWKDGHLRSLSELVTPNLFNTVEDNAGTLWIGTLTEGLLRVTRPLTHMLVPEGAPEGAATLLLDRDHRVWLGSRGVQYLQGQLLKEIAHTRDRGGRLTFFTALAQAQDGAILAASRRGILRIDASGVHPIDLPGGDYGDIMALLPSQDGSVWVGCKEGLYRIGSGPFLHLASIEGQSPGSVTSIALAEGDELWVGTSRGLSKLHTANPVSWQMVPGWRYGAVSALFTDARGILWAGTDGYGLVRVAGNSMIDYSTRNGLPDNTVAALLEDDTGDRPYLWLDTRRGLVRIPKSELESYANGDGSPLDSMRLSEADGIVSEHPLFLGQRLALQDQTGQLFFSTRHGVAVFDPRAVEFGRTAPMVYVEEHRIDGREVPSEDAITLRPGQTNLEIHYTGIADLNSDQLLFRYRLAGLDQQWTQAGTERVAVFSRLPVGDYEFEVEATGSSGMRSEKAAAIPIHVLPRFYQRRWVQIISGLFLLAGLIALLRYRYSMLRRSQTRQRVFARTLMASQEAERKRIAAELHDGLGQHLVLINNLSLMGVQSTDRHADGDPLYDRIAEQTSEAIDELRTISYNLRPYQLDRLGLTRAIRALSDHGRQIFAGDWTHELDNIDGVIETDLEIAFYRIVQECINNILKHSNATQASIVLRRSDLTLILEIKDNGQGLPTDQSSMAGFGMIGMRERAEALGGKLQLSTPSGGGTCVIVTVPVPGGTPVQDKEKQSGLAGEML
jgi:signal transduction histidine kinase/ligand-binding sensor domain-containing protein